MGGSLYTKEELDFAYKYPFSEEAKKVVKELDMKSVEQIPLAIGKARLEEALQEERLAYDSKLSYGKSEQVASYVYARMLLSAMKSGKLLVTRYANAEAHRCADALEADSDSNLERLGKELGIAIKKHNGSFTIPVAAFLRNAPNSEEFSLVNQRLDKGTVALDRHMLVKVMEVAIRNLVEGGIPKPEQLPRQVIEKSREVKRPVLQSVLPSKPGATKSWIEKLLSTPIEDCRHRTVNLILAPYLVNEKGLGVDKAVEVISSYITLCKTINPQTNISERYIKYQCQYAKNKGLRPLSLRRARVELGSIDFKTMFGEEDDEHRDGEKDGEGEKHG